MNFRISELIFKSISKTISEDEKSILNDWLFDPKNKAIYKNIIDSNYINKKIAIHDDLNTDEIYKKIESKMANDSKKRYLRVLKYAAIFIGVMGLGYFYQDAMFQTSEKLYIEDEKITLQLDDGTIKILDEAANAQILDKQGNTLGVQNGSQLVYGDAQIEEKLVYNTLNVPYGKRFELVLSDGTKVHLNAGTSLRYPVKFIGKGTRDVFLNGEAYFDVAKDTKHPFIVNSSNLNIHVVGTEFNVTSYPEDDTIDVVLVEGSVGLYSGENSKYDSSKDVTLSPSYKGAYNKNSKQISTQKVQTNLYTSWRKGEQLYRNMPFKKILPKLERFYNVTIINTNTALEDELFYASFKDETIENVLTYFNEVHKIQYQIENNNIIIK